MDLLLVKYADMCFKTWGEYFQRHLFAEGKVNLTSIDWCNDTGILDDGDMLKCPITLDEVQRSINKLKLGKSTRLMVSVLCLISIRVVKYHQ